MPHVVFTVGELIEAAVVTGRNQSAAIRALADLDAKPLDPGESVAARHHKIAKLGKQLAETFAMLDLLSGGQDQAPEQPAPPRVNAQDSN
jgi:hypothetical protein